MLPFGSLVLPVLVLLSLRLATGADEHDVHDGPLSPISYPPDRMVPLSHRRRSGVTVHSASKLRTPQSPSHHFLIAPNWLKVTAPREPVRAGRHVRGPLTVTMTVVDSTAGLVLQLQPL